MINIAFFADKLKAGQQKPQHDLPVTFRGVVYPWHLDHMGHMNVQHYVGMFDQSSWTMLAQLGLDAPYFRENRRGMAALEQTVKYKRELRAGDIFEIRSSVLEVREKTVLILHTMHLAGTDTVVASTTILGVHIDTDVRKGVPLPAEARRRAHALTS